ncbi:MAG: DNA double-strand break repair nuclease NurA [Promethearchaeota archaeon]
MAIKILKESDLLQERNSCEDSIRKRIDIVSKAIINIEAEKEKFVEIWNQMKKSFVFPKTFNKMFNIHDECLFTPVKEYKLTNKRVGAVDGSVLRESMLGIDLIASKARGVVFNFKKDDSPVVRYFPEEINQNFNLFGIFHGSSTREIDFYTNIERLLAELELVHTIVKSESKLDAMIIDGPLYFPEIVKGREENYYIKKFNKQIADIFMKILNLTDKKEIMLVGVVKDSIKRDYMEILGKLIPFLISKDETFKKFYNLDFRRLLTIFKDYDFFYRFLKEKERSFIMKTFPREGKFIPASNFEKYMKDMDFGIYSLLLKPVPLDFPLKLEFIARNDDHIVKKIGEKLSRLLSPMSRIMVNYSEPSPQMEAHKRVVIPEQDFKTIIEVIRQRTGYCSTLLKKRRDRRPF